MKKNDQYSITSSSLTSVASTGPKVKCKALSVPAKGQEQSSSWTRDADTISYRRTEPRSWVSMLRRVFIPCRSFSANGVTSANDVAKVHFDEFESTHTPYVFDESPSVLSVGKKCMEEGYSFVWPANGVPYMISLDKENSTGGRRQHTLHRQGQ